MTSSGLLFQGLIYVCGGFDGQSRLRSLEVYHPKIDEWRILEDMTTAREGAGLIVVDETLYCLGGYDGFHLLNSMEAFDLRRGTWSICKPMYMRRSGAGCALLGDTVYVCGGYGGAEGRGPLHLDTVEAYNTRLQQWTLVTSMNVPRCYVGACPLAGKIYVAAGYNGSRLLDTVESYDPVENVWWLHEDSRMNHERCDTGMCVVRFLSCAESSVPSQTPTNSKVLSSVASGTANRLRSRSATSTTSSLITTSAGQIINIQPPIDSADYRVVPTLPSSLPLRGGLTSLFRPGVLSLEMSHPNPTSTTSSSALGFRMSAFRDTTAPSCRALPFVSLRRHPHLPHRHRPNRLQYPPDTLHPGFLHTNRGTFSNRCIQSNRQLLSAINPDSVTQWAELPATSTFGDTLPVSIAHDLVHPTASLLQPSSDAHSTDVPQTVMGYAEVNQLSAHSRVDPRDEPTYSEDSGRVMSSLHEAVGRDESGDRSSSTYRPHCLNSSTAIPLEGNQSRGSSASSPTLLTRMYHSAPERYSGQPRPSELFRSAEALNLVHSDYRSWMDTDFSLGVHDSFVSGQAPGFYHGRHDPCHGAVRPHQLFPETREDALFSDVLDSLPGETLSGYLRLDENSGDDGDREGQSEGSADDDDFRNASSSHVTNVRLAEVNSETQNRFEGMGVLDSVATISHDHVRPFDISASVPVVGDSGVARPRPTLTDNPVVSPTATSSAVKSSCPSITASGDDAGIRSTEYVPTLSNLKQSVPASTLVDPHLSKLASSTTSSKSGKISCYLDSSSKCPPTISSSPSTTVLPASSEGTSLPGTSAELQILSSGDGINLTHVGLASMPEPVTSSDQLGEIDVPDELNCHTVPESVDATPAQSSSVHLLSNEDLDEVSTPNPDSRSDGEGEETEEDSVVGMRNPAVGQLDNES